MSKVLVTGGAGYIGSHTTLQLLNNGYKVVVLDNLDNSNLEALRRVRKLVDVSNNNNTGSQKDATKEMATGISEADPSLIIETPVDLLDMDASRKVFQKHGPFQACIHFAGLKAVGESVSIPLHYMQNNVGGALNLLYLLQEFGCRRFVFSSSATVYGDPDSVPIKEDAPLRATNPYGRSKLMIEDILRDVDKSEANQWSIAILRYFNPIGAHESGTIGEDPQGIPNNLLPFVSQVAAGVREKLSVFGSDWPTPDGTGVRDYLHIMDLADAHVAATTKVINTPHMGAKPYNLGTGHGSSVLEVVKAFEKVSGKNIPYEMTSRRPGDIATCYADASLAEKELGWKAKRSVEDACADAWRWVTNNPRGYRSMSEEKGKDKEEQADQKRNGLVFSMYPLHNS